MERFRVVWFNAQNLAVARLGFSKTAGLMVCQSVRESLADLTGILRWSFVSESQHRVVTRTDEEQALHQNLRGRGLQTGRLLRVLSRGAS